jgi:hypothetical protein
MNTIIGGMEAVNDHPNMCMIMKTAIKRVIPRDRDGTFQVRYKRSIPRDKAAEIVKDMGGDRSMSSAISASHNDIDPGVDIAIVSGTTGSRHWSFTLASWSYLGIRINAEGHVLYTDPRRTT